MALTEDGYSELFGSEQRRGKVGQPPMIALAEIFKTMVRFIVLGYRRRTTDVTTLLFDD